MDGDPAPKDAAAAPHPRNGFATPARAGMSYLEGVAPHGLRPEQDRFRHDLCESFTAVDSRQAFRTPAGRILMKRTMLIAATLIAALWSARPVAAEVQDARGVGDGSLALAASPEARVPAPLLDLAPRVDLLSQFGATPVQFC